MNSKDRKNFQTHQQRRSGQNTGVNNVIPQEIKSYITEEGTAKQMVQCAERLGEELKDVSTSQIRNAYGNMKKLEMSGWNNRTRREVLLLKPRLAYAAGRHGKGLHKLKNVMDHAIDAVTDEESFQRFCEFFEAIVAYHKAAGGK